MINAIGIRIGISIISQGEVIPTFANTQWQLSANNWNSVTTTWN